MATMTLLTANVPLQLKTKALHTFKNPPFLTEHAEKQPRSSFGENNPGAHENAALFSVIWTITVAGWTQHRLLW